MLRQPLEIFKEEIVRLLSPRVSLEREEIDAALRQPPGPEMGDCAFPCFSLAKIQRRAPHLIAQDLAEQLKPTKLLSKIRADGPYLNFFFNPIELARVTLGSVWEQGSQYGSSEEGDGKCVVIDFSSPNIAKPMGIGHLRSTVIGNSLSLVFEKLGYGVIRINHLGDWGTQFGAVIYAYKAWGSQQTLEKDPIGHLYELYVRFHNEAQRNPQLEEEARIWFKKLEEKDEEAFSLWRSFVDLSIGKLKEVYNLLGVKFDHYWGESFYEPQVGKMLQKMQSEGLAVEDEGALVMDLSEYEMPACLLRKKDGSTLYATRDLAAAIYRHQRFKFDKMLYVVGAPQSLHFRQVFKVLEMMGYGWVKDCVHVPFGHMRFGGEEMATRKGTQILLEEVYSQAYQLARQMVEEKNPEAKDKEEIAQKLAIGALFFADLKNDRVQDVEFDWDEILNLEGDTGPYIHYAYVRISSILRRYGRAVTPKVDFSLYKTPQEAILISLLARYPEVILDAAQSFRPSSLARFLLSLSKQFSQFYHQCPVLQAEEEVKNARLLLVSCVQAVLKDGLRLLGIETVEEM